MANKLGAEENMKGVDAGYENAVLDLMGKKAYGYSSSGAHLMGGPGEEISIVVGPNVKPYDGQSMMGDDTGQIVAASLALPIAAFAGYGIYKAVGGGSSSPSSGSKPWLYKMSPSYWFKSDREKRLTRALKEGGYQDAKNKEDLALAEQAYKATEAAREKEMAIQRYERGLAGKPLDEPAPAAPAPADATSTSGDDGPPPGYPPEATGNSKYGPAGYPKRPSDVSGSYPMPGTNKKLDKKLLTALSKAGYPIQAGSTWVAGKSPQAALDLVAGIVGDQAAARAWLLAFFERQQLTFEGSSGKLYQVVGGKITMAAPAAPGDVTLATHVEGWGRSPWEKGTGFSTAMSTIDPTMMRTTGARRKSTAVRGWGRSPWEKGLVMPTTMSTIDTTMAPTTGARRRTNVKGMFVGYAPSPWEKSLGVSTAMSLVDETEDATTGAPRPTTARRKPSSVVGFGNRGAFRKRANRKPLHVVGSTFPWETSLIYTTAMNTVVPTSMPTTGARRYSSAVKGWSSPWEQNLNFSTAVDLAASTVDPTTGARKPTTARRSGSGVSGRNVFVGYGPSPWEKSLGYSTAMSTVMPTMMRTTGARRKSTAMRGADVTYFDGPGIAPGTTTSMMPTYAPPVYAPAAYTPPVYQSTDPSQSNYVPPTYAPPTNYGPLQVGPSPAYGYDGRRRRRHHHHHRGGGYGWQGSPPPGAPPAVSGNAFVGAAPVAPSPAQQQQMLVIMAAHQSGNIKALAAQAGLASKRPWTAADVDKIAIGLLTKLKGLGHTPGAADANLARSVIRMWASKSGVSVVGNAFVGGGTFVGFSLGGFLKTVGKVAVTPVAAAFWGVGKAVQGVGWVAGKAGQGLAWGGGKTLGAMWGKKGGPAPAPGMPGAPGAPGAPGMVPYSAPGATGLSQQQIASMQQAQQRLAAASARIKAAEDAQETAILHQQQVADIQAAQDQAAAAEAAAQAAEGVAMKAQMTQDIPELPAALQDASMGGWSKLKSVPPAFVGPNAAAAAKNTPTGKALRDGANVARKARQDPATKAKVKAIEVAAKKGNPTAKKVDATIKAGALADHQRLDALHANAQFHRRRANMAQLVLRKALRVGGSPTGRFAAWKPYKKGSIISIGADADPATKKAAKVKSKALLPALPPIPGVPNDVLVALTAASNSMGVPPEVAASVVAAARAGDPTAKKELADAARVYKAAQKGDPVAKKQIAAVVSDMKTGYGPAAQKAAVMSAAVGTVKGTKNFQLRQKAKAESARRFAAAKPVSALPESFLHPSSPWYAKIISYGVGPGVPL